MRTFLIIIIFLIQHISTIANEITKDTTEKHYYVNNELVVSAGRFIDFSFERPEHISSIDNRKIDFLKPRTSPEALLSLPGVFLQKTNHGSGSPFVRGLTGQQTLILVDGIRLNNATTRSGPNQYMNTMDIHMTERIEVMRGSGSVQYGSDAIGGVVHLFTKNPQFAEHTRLQSRLFAQYMSSDMEKTIGGDFELNSQKFAFYGNVNYNDFGHVKAGQDSIQEPTGYKQLSFSAKAKYAIDKANDITFNYQRTAQSDVPLFHKVTLENFQYNLFSPQNRDLAYIKWNLSLEEQLLRNISFTAFFAKSEEGRKSRKNNTPTVVEELDEDRTIGAIAQSDIFPMQNWRINFGAEVYHDLVKSSKTSINTETNSISVLRGLYPDNSKYTSAAVFLLNRTDVGNFIFNYGLRFNSVMINVKDITLGEVEINPTAFVWNFAATYRINQNHYVSVGANTAFRSPNIDDMGTLGVVDFRYEIPSNNLSPEKALNIELGYKVNYEDFYVGVSIYRSNLTDFISRVRGQFEGKDSVGGYPVFIKLNSSEAYIEGAEVNAIFRIYDDFIADFALTYTYGQNVTRGEPMRRIPPIFGNFGFEYNYNYLRLRIDWLFAGKQDRLAAGDKADNRIGPNGTDSWDVFNLHASYRLKSFTFGLSLINLTDELYRYHGSGVDMYGRSFKFSINYLLEIL